MARWWRHILVAVASTAAALPLRVQLDLGHSSSLPVLDGAAFAKGGDRSGSDGGGGRGGEGNGGGKGAGSGKGGADGNRGGKGSDGRSGDAGGAGGGNGNAGGGKGGSPGGDRGGGNAGAGSPGAGNQGGERGNGQGGDKGDPGRGGRRRSADPPEVQAAVSEEAPALGRVPVTAAPEELPGPGQGATPMALVRRLR